ncbi:Opi1-domain-containing protein [Gloeophyllum trabeum ATCC 11539]|uniref:Opi1-domain-containing protein n=1 Tax=Gloeophyllum trabeum (strain ATCC 11539 / FP-39264 / Madison 617) TaxID=670483 RepID=S7QBH2_GLOTA|nr:Opi1-domain-containing protein [Gloeophyllum trabeum ATCC 11539]EPQ56708.1 Opi1-domain-containing protein [Gloeophyllum trabeum ATCC 11539]
MALEDQDESVRIAVRALDDMRNRTVRSQSPPSYASTSFQPTPALSVASSSSSPSTEPSSLPPEDVNSPDFVSRVSRLPIVNTALSAYEQSKASSRVVKFGAEMMESSMKSLSRPVMDRLPVNQLDEFACRQLDRLGRYQRRLSSPHPERMQTDSPRNTRAVSPSRSPTRGRRMDSWSARMDEEQRERDVSMTPSDRYSDTRSRPGTPTQSPRREEGESQQQVAQRSRWQAVLLEAGGLGAAVSEESMRRLKYVLQWLMYATAHIDAQILVLRDFIASLQPRGSVPSAHAPISPEHMKKLNDVKQDVVHTVRQVVDVVSKYAGGALPEPARARVRGFILTLPQRWATAANRQRHETVSADTSPVASTSALPPIHPVRGRGAKPYSREPSRPSSPSGSAPSSPRLSRAAVHSRQGSGHAHAHAHPAPTAGSATVAAQRILTLATESLDMMRGVTAVVKDSLDRADAWVDRLRVVGIQRQGQSDAGSPTRPLESPSSSTLWSPSGNGHAPPPLPSPLNLSDTYPSFPVPVDAPSPMGPATSSMGSLSLHSASSTPRVSARELDADPMDRTRYRDNRSAEVERALSESRKMDVDS